MWGGGERARESEVRHGGGVIVLHIVTPIMTPQRAKRRDSELLQPSAEPQPGRISRLCSFSFALSIMVPNLRGLIRPATLMAPGVGLFAYAIRPETASVVFSSISHSVALLSLLPPCRFC